MSFNKCVCAHSSGCCSSVFNYLQAADGLSQTRTPDMASLECTSRRTGGLTENPAKTQLIAFSAGGGCKQTLGRSSVKYAQAIQRLCIIERSKWEQDEDRASLIVNVFTVSGKTAV